MTPLPDLSQFSSDQKDDLIRTLWPLIDQVRAQSEQITALTKRVAELEAKLGDPPKNSDNSSVPPSKSQKANRPDKSGPLCANDDETIAPWEFNVEGIEKR